VGTASLVIGLVLIGIGVFIFYYTFFGAILVGHAAWIDVALYILPFGGLSVVAGSLLLIIMTMIRKKK